MSVAGRQGRGPAVVAVAVAVAALVGAAGCAPGSTGPRSTRAEPSGPVRELTRAEQDRVDLAEQRLIRACMEREGFRYWVAPRVGADTARAFTYRFVQDDVAWAREHGYGERLRQAFFEAKQRDPNVPYRNRLSPAGRREYLAALTGGPDAPMLSVRLPTGASVRSQDGGCAHSARRQLYGDTEAFFHADKVAANLVPVYTPRLVRDPRFTKGVKAWSACVREATGRSYADPAALREDLNERSARLDATEAHRLEVRLAVAEAACARRTSLTTTLRELDRRYGGPVRERYAEEVSTSSRMKLAALRRADGMDHRR